MIHVVNYKNRDQYSYHIDLMYKQRKQVFFDRLKWDVTISGELEFDEFDTKNTVYLLNIDCNNRLVGSVRLIPSVLPNMLNDVFSQLLPAGEKICDPQIWESSRFCADCSLDRKIGEKGISAITAELGLAMNEFGMEIGLNYVVTVVDAFMFRLLSRAGCAGETIGTPTKIGKVNAYALSVQVGEGTREAWRAASGIQTPVIDWNAASSLPTITLLSA